MIYDAALKTKGSAGPTGTGRKTVSESCMLEEFW